MDNIDSEENAELMPFRSIMNDYHLRDLSRKIKSALKVKAHQGELFSARTPYGLIKNTDCRTQLLIDEYAAEIVRRIFQLRVDGTGLAKIAATLN